MPAALASSKEMVLPIIRKTKTRQVLSIFVKRLILVGWNRRKDGRLYFVVFL